MTASKPPDRPRRIVEGCRGTHEIVRDLGKGGMAETLLAVRRGVGGVPYYYCLKRMHPGHDPSEFLEEAYTHIGLAHSLIVRAYEADIEKDPNTGRPFLLMEYVDGVDLRNLLLFYSNREERMPAPLAMYIAHDAAEALHYVHTATGPDGQSLGIVHRDVSTSNILLGVDGFLKLLDFGIAARANKPSFTVTGMAKGAPGYMAPEQIERGATRDHRADLFSLGAVLYECLSGHNPFRSGRDSEKATYRAILTGSYDPLTAHVPDLPRDLVALVHQLLEHRPEDRPRDMLEVVERLEALALEPSLRCVAPRRMAAAEVRACKEALPSKETAPSTASDRLYDALARADDAMDLARELLSGEPPPGWASGPLAIPDSDDDDEDNEGAQAPAPRSANAGHAPSRVRGRMILGFGLMGALAITLLISSIFARSAAHESLTQTASPAAAPMARTERPTSAPGPSSPPPVASSPPSVSPPTPAMTTAPPSASTTHTRAPAVRSANVRVENGEIKVVVFNCGEVTVDGRAYGLAPQTISLPPGRHSVDVLACNSKPDAKPVRRSIRVVGGKTDEVVFRLSTKTTDESR